MLQETPLKSFASPAHCETGLQGPLDGALPLFGAALNAVSNAVVIADRDGRIVWVNRAFSELTGYARDEVIGKNSRLLKSSRHDAAFYRKLWQTVLAGKVWRGEITNRRKDGTFYDEEMTITPVRGPDGTVH